MIIFVCPVELHQNNNVECENAFKLKGRFYPVHYLNVIFELVCCLSDETNVDIFVLLYVPHIF